MTKQELRQWIIDFAKAPAYPEVIEAIDMRINNVIQSEIEAQFTPAEIDYLLTLCAMNEKGKHFAYPDRDIVEQKLRKLK